MWGLASACPGGYIGTDTFSGTPVQCQETNTGVSAFHFSIGTGFRIGELMSR